MWVTFSKPLFLILDCESRQGGLWVVIIPPRCMHQPMRLVWALKANMHGAKPFHMSSWFSGLRPSHN